MTDPILLRRRVRWVLSLLPQVPAGEEPPRIAELLIFAKLLPDFRDLKADEMHAAMIWNLSNGYAEFARNKDEERDEWCLTTEGWRKEGMAS